MTTLLEEPLLHRMGMVGSFPCCLNVFAYRWKNTFCFSEKW